MTPVACRYCGLPFKVHRVHPGREYFCCTGCATLARVPVDAQGEFPVNGHLVSALVVGFLYFNQLLFWSLAALLARDDSQLALAARFHWLMAGAALVVWLALMIIPLREKTARTPDFLMAAAALAAHGFALLSSRPPSGLWLAVANAAWLLWSLRGVLRLKLQRRS